MKYIIIITFITIFTNISFSQQKTYTGKFQRGIATYDYYENQNLERIKNGSFKYEYEIDQVNLYRNHIPAKVLINGYYKNNLLDGRWEDVYITNSEVPNLGKVKIKRTSLINLDNGIRNGVWQCKYETELNNKVETNNANVIFVKGKIVGEVNLFGYIGKFNKLGEFDNVWSFKSEKNDIEIIAEFKNGIISRFFKRKISTGEILINFNQSEIVNSYSLQLNSEIRQNNTPIKLFNNKKYKYYLIDKFNNRSLSDEVDVNEISEFILTFAEKISKCESGTIGYPSVNFNVFILKEFIGKTDEEIQEEALELIKNQKNQANKEIDSFDNKLKTALFNKNFDAYVEIYNQYKNFILDNAYLEVKNEIYLKRSIQNKYKNIIDSLIEVRNIVKNSLNSVEIDYYKLTYKINGEVKNIKNKHNEHLKQFMDFSRKLDNINKPNSDRYKLYFILNGINRREGNLFENYFKVEEDIKNLNYLLNVKQKLIEYFDKNNKDKLKLLENLDYSERKILEFCN